MLIMDRPSAGTDAAMAEAIAYVWLAEIPMIRIMWLPIPWL